MASLESEFAIQDMCKNLRFATQIFALQEAFPGV